MREVRLQVHLAHAGVASRRHCEALITAGRVSVNGHVVTELGTKVDPARDAVTVDGKPVAEEAHVYLVLHKPRGYVTTADDPEGRPTVLDLVKARAAAAEGRGGRRVEEAPHAERIYPVGRLDFNTDGVLVLTNDGELANALMHPRGGVPKTYHAKLRGEVGAEALVRLREGVRLDDGVMTRPAEARLLEADTRHSWIELTIKEGRNRQVHRMADAVGHPVLKLTRVGYGPLTVEDLRPGRWRPISPEELRALRVMAGLGDKPPSRQRAGATPQRSEAAPERSAGPRSRSAGPRSRSAGSGYTSRQRGDQQPFGLSEVEGRISAHSPLDSARGERTAGPRHRSSATQHRSSAAQHRSDAPQHRSSAAQHRSDAPQHRSSAAQHRSDATQHRSSVTQQRSSAPQQRSSAPQHRSSAPQHRSDAPKHRSSAPQHRTDAAQHRPSAPQHRSDATKHRSDATQHRSSAPQHRSDVTKHRSSVAQQRSDTAQHRSSAGQQRSDAGLHRPGAAKHHPAPTKRRPAAAGDERRGSRGGRAVTPPATSRSPSAPTSGRRGGPPRRPGPRAR